MDFNTLLASSSREGERQTLVLLSILIVIPISDTLRGIDTPCEEILLWLPSPPVFQIQLEEHLPSGWICEGVWRSCSRRAGIASSFVVAALNELKQPQTNTETVVGILQAFHSLPLQNDTVTQLYSSTESTFATPRQWCRLGYFQSVAEYFNCPCSARH